MWELLRNGLKVQDDKEKLLRLYVRLCVCVRVVARACVQWCVGGGGGDRVEAA